MICRIYQFYEGALEGYPVYGHQGNPSILSKTIPHILSRDKDFR